jgi:hypothetical protein
MSHQLSNKEDLMAVWRTLAMALILGVLLGVGTGAPAAAQRAPAGTATEAMASLIDALSTDSLLVNNDTVLDQVLRDSLSHRQFRVVYLNDALTPRQVALWSGLLTESEVVSRNRQELSAALSRNPSLRAYVEQHTPAGQTVEPLALDVRGGMQSVIDRLNNALGNAVNDVLCEGDLGRAVDRMIGTNEAAAAEGVPVTLYVLAPQ